MLCCHQITSSSNAEFFGLTHPIIRRCSVHACHLQTFPLGSKVASCFWGRPTCSWLPHLPEVACSAYLIEEGIVSRLDPSDVLLACNVYLHHRLDVVAQELSGFKHLQPNLQREQQKRPDDGGVNFPPPTETPLSRVKLFEKEHSRYYRQREPPGRRLEGAEC